MFKSSSCLQDIFQRVGKQRGVDSVSQLQAMRKADFRKGKRLGKEDHIVRWKRPLIRSLSWHAQKALPEYLTVREWDNQRQQGNEVSAEVMCSDNPELVEALKSRILSVKATDWLVETDDGDDNFLSLPDTATTAASLDETTVPPTELDVEQFLPAARDYGFINDAELGAWRKTENGGPTSSIAAQLVAENKLTQYQADVLLRQSGEPLILDRYEVLDKLDQGGMGIVYRARHRSMDRQVAVKILPLGTVASPEKTQRFQREIKAAKLSHPNIVASYDAHEAKGGIHFLVMEYVTGKDLSKVVNETGPLSV